MPPEEEEVDTTGQEISELIVSEVISSSADEIETRRLDRLCVPYCTTIALNNALRTSAWGSIVPDMGSPEASKNEPSWCIGNEPKPAKIDSWARGRMAVKSKKKTDEFADIEHMKGRGAGSLSPTGTRSVHSKSSGFGRSRGGGSRGGKRKKKEEVTYAVVAIDIDGEDDDTTGGKLLGVKSDMGTLLDGKGESASELMRELKIESDKKRLAAKRELQMAKEEEEKRLEHEAQMKKLADKNYTYDDDGNLIIIEPLEGSSLPPPGGMSIGTKVADYIEPAPVTPGGSRRGKRLRSPKSSSRPTSQQTQRKGKTDVPAPFFTVSSVAQPSFIQSMTINPGVSLKEGLRHKAGPEVTGDSSHMSRREYDDRRRRDEESYYASMGGGSSIGGEFDLDNQTIGSNESLTLDGTEAFMSQPPSPRPEIEMRLGGDVDSLAGARKAKPREPTPDDTMSDAHEALINDPNWGKAIISGNEVSPSKLPNKPDTKQMEIISKMSGGGPNAKKRRDRMMPSAMIPQAERSHLPAPPIGFSTGHGFTVAGGGDGGDDLSVGSKSKTNPSSAEKSRFPPIDAGRTVDDTNSKKSKGKSKKHSILGSPNGGVIHEVQRGANRLLQ